MILAPSPSPTGQPSPGLPTPSWPGQPTASAAGATSSSSPPAPAHGSAQVIASGPDAGTAPSAPAVATASAGSRDGAGTRRTAAAVSDLLRARGYDVFTRCFHDKDLLVRTTGDVIALSPPLILDRGHVDQIFGRVAEAIRETA